MAGTIVERSKKNHGETVDLSAAAGPAVEERQGDDQEDSRTGRRTEEGVGEVESCATSDGPKWTAQSGSLW